MVYRDRFDRPSFSRGRHTTQDWLNWMISQTA
jgi:hypothetical protein